MGKLLIITNIPNQYRIPLFNELNKEIKKLGGSLHIIFGTSGYQNRKSVIDLKQCQFNYEILDPGIFSGIEKKTGFLFYKGLKKRIKKINPKQIIVAGYSIATIKVALSKYEFYIWSGSINKGNGGFFSKLKEIQRKSLLKKANGALAYSSLAKKNFERLGLDSKSIKIIGNTVDTEFFKDETDQLRKQSAVISKKHLTYIGYLTPRKNVAELIYIIKILLSKRNDFILDIIGDGSSLAELISLTSTLGVEDYVNFHGFKQKDELPKYLSLSSCFLFQTNFDIWGLVLNEAMAAGVPCISSINAGATEDLIIEGVTGFKVDFSEHEKVASKIDWMLSNPEKSIKITEKARELIESKYTTSACAKNILSIYKS